VSDPPGLASPTAARALRAPGTVWHGIPEGSAPHVVHLDPPDGAQGVFRDAPVVASFSRPTDPRSISAETFLVVDEDGHVPGGVWTSLDGRVAVWTPARLLSSGILHCVRLAGVRDRQGRALDVHESAFVPGDLSLGDLAPHRSGSE
jgi:hypothetical protein